jgi:hypothetical protein
LTGRLPNLFIAMKRLLALLVLITVCGGAGAADPLPLVRAHAHNDYEHTRPLLDALDCGFGSIEADVHLVDGRLLVAHDTFEVKKERTLESLYLDPLRERVTKNAGRVYRNGPTIILLIDVKTAAGPGYTALHEILKNYASILTVFRDGVMTPGAVTVVISGSRAPDLMSAQTVRYAGMDGRIGDLAGKAGKEQIPLVSDNWQSVFTWRWKGNMPAEDAAKLKMLVSQAHQQGRLIRFWNTPDTPAAWKILYDAGVDLINTDNLRGLQGFLLEQASGASK